MAESNSADAATALAPAESFFGGAFFGLELPPGYTEPSEGIPDSWTGEFAETAGAAVLSRLHRASRGCRLWVLRHIPTLRLSLSNADGKPWGSDVLIVASALAVRGPRPTRVAVEYYGPQVQAAEGANHGFLEQVAEALAGDALTELHITCKRRSAMGQQAPAADVSDFVARVARACPRLASLTVTDAVCRLPPPTQLPSLTEFSTSRANSPSEACVTASCSTVPQYLAQLTSLHLKSAYVRLDSQGALWASIFSAQAPIAQHLTHLTIHVSLDDSAVDVLLAKAPSLQRVAVDSIDVQKVHTGQWAVERVQSRRDVTAKALACLPTRASGQTELVCPEVQFFESAEEIDPQTQQRLSAWVINAERITIPRDLPTDQAIALLLRLGRLHTRNRPAVRVDGCTWTADFVQTITPIVRELEGSYKLHVELPGEQVLTDEVLGWLLSLGTAVHSVGVPDLRLESDLHGDAVWPWQELVVRNDRGEMQIADLLKLPDPCQAEEPVLLCVAGYVVIPALSEDTEAAVLDRLSNLVWSSVDDFPVLRTTLAYSGSPHTLDEQMALLACVEPHHVAGIEYKLQGWPMTHAVMQALQELDACMGLEFEQCTWPLQPKEYKALGAYMPETVEEWMITGEVPVSVLYAICEGVYASREECGLPDLRLTMYDAPKTRQEWVDGRYHAGVKVYFDALTCW